MRAVLRSIVARGCPLSSRMTYSPVPVPASVEHVGRLVAHELDRIARWRRLQITDPLPHVSHRGNPLQIPESSTSSGTSPH